MANTSNYDEQGGARRVIGGELDVASGGELDVEAGASLKLDGTAVASSAAELDQRVLTAELTLGSSGQTYICSPVAGDVAAVYSTIEAATSTSDETLTAKDKDGNSIGTITIAHGDGAGTVDSLTSGLSNTDVSAGDMIKIETDGKNDNSINANVFVVVQIS